MARGQWAAGRAQRGKDHTSPAAPAPPHHPATRLRAAPPEAVALAGQRCLGGGRGAARGAGRGGAGPAARGRCCPAPGGPWRPLSRGPCVGPARGAGGGQRTREPALVSGPEERLEYTWLCRVGAARRSVTPSPPRPSVSAPSSGRGARPEPPAGLERAPCLCPESRWWARCHRLQTLLR